MSATTIEVPATQVEAVRQSLLDRREITSRRDEIDDLLRQIAACLPAAPAACELTGPRGVLWSAVYDSLCAAAERLADLCNDYWKGEVGLEEARAALAHVAAGLDLLSNLGPPPGH